MQPRYDQAELPIQGIEPHEIETPLLPMRSYDEMKASRYTDPTARWTYPGASSNVVLIQLDRGGAKTKHSSRVLLYLLSSECGEPLERYKI
jgi:hypothetical protein